MNFAKLILWYLVILGAFMPSILVFQYVAKDMGMPTFYQVLTGIWIGASIWLIADRTFKPYTP